MKNLIKKSMALITAIVLCAIPTVQAKELDNLSSYQELISEETIENDGLYITVSVFETKNTATKAIPYTTVYEKTGKKTYTAKNPLLKKSAAQNERNFRVDFYAEDAIRLSPYKDDK